MTTTSIKGGFNRLYVVLTVAWIAYCAVIFPLQQRKEGLSTEFDRYVEDRGACKEEQASESASRDCLKKADEAWRERLKDWSFSKTYADTWKLILGASLGVPVVLYGLIRGLAAVCVWIWRGYKVA